MGNVVRTAASVAAAAFLAMACAGRSSEVPRAPAAPAAPAAEQDVLPDAVQIEYQHLPAFIARGDLANLVDYGATDVKDLFVPWTWAQASQEPAWSVISCFDAWRRSAPRSSP